MLNWATVSSLATGAGTLVLAVATFASVRSANRAARVAEESLLAALRPLLVPSRLQDSTQKIFFGDAARVALPGGCAVADIGAAAAETGAAAAETGAAVIYLAISLRNVGSGIGVLHGWRLATDWHADQRPAPESFRTQQRDLYIPTADLGFWQAAFRDPADPQYAAARSLAGTGDVLAIDLLYGDYLGGQRTVSRFLLRRVGGGEHGGGGQLPIVALPAPRPPAARR